MREVLEKHAIATAFQQKPSMPTIYPLSRAVSFRLLGDRCTRGCFSCGVPHNSRPPKPDPREPVKIAHAVNELALDNVILTAVHRDDIKDGGAGHFARTISEIKKRRPWSMVEAVVPDFHASISAMGKVVAASPDVISHNIGPVKRLEPSKRKARTGFKRSLTSSTA
ncbi:TPA: hypothetical protein EYP38_04535 [Candidatus Micrarchaeota archaeon]|nr:hypothetical protein [Candidatus Micrarchaeota archaeon]